MSSFSSPQPSPFAAPTPQQVRAHLNRNPPRRPSRAIAWAGLFMLGIAMAMTFSPSAAGGLMPLVGLVLAMSIFGAMWFRAWRMRDLERQSSRAFELAMARSNPESLLLAWRLLPGVTTVPHLHGRTVALIAQNLDRLDAFDGAIVAYDELIERLPEDHPASVHFRVLRATAHLLVDRLTDADTELRRLRGRIERFADTAIGAAYRLAELVQCVRTYHYDDAIELADHLVSDLRPLGVDAGFGHALMALSYQKRAERLTMAPEPAADSDEQAAQTTQADDDATVADVTQVIARSGQWWRRATLLLPVDVLVRRFKELHAVAGDPRMAPHRASWRPPGD